MELKVLPGFLEDQFCGNKRIVPLITRGHLPSVHSLLPQLSLLLSLVAAAGYFLVNAYREGQEIRRYVGGPFSQQLLVHAGVRIDRWRRHLGFS